MKNNSLVNPDKVTSLRYCPNCDPRCKTPIVCEPRKCECGYTLCIATSVSGTLTRTGSQYDGPKARYPFPVRMVTGNFDPGSRSYLFPPTAN